MANRIPTEVTRWVIDGGLWLPASGEVEVAHYTNATLFVYEGLVIDGRRSGLTAEQVVALKAKFLNDVVELKDGKRGFTLPLVPVGTVIDITPERAADFSIANEKGHRKPRPKMSRKPGVSR